jgi:dTMP kinase
VFITFEGPEGAGKTTVLRAVADALRAEGRDVFVTREPGDGPVGGEIRQILLHGHDLQPLSEVFLFLADRAEHVARMIRPALEEGKVVLCDRYADSTVVYQGYGRGLDIDRLRAWNAVATGGLRPHLTILLDLDPVVGLQRLRSKDRLDAEPLEFHRRVRDGFLTEAACEPERWHIVDASRDADEVQTAVLQAINARLASAPF